MVNDGYMMVIWWLMMVNDGYMMVNDGYIINDG